MAIGPSSFTAGVDVNSANNPAGTSIVLTKPSGVVDNDVLFIFAFDQSGTTKTPPSGWTMAYATVARAGGLYYKVIPSAAAETATSYTFAWAASGRLAGVIWRMSGVDTTNPIDVYSSETTGGGGTVTLPSVTATSAGRLLMNVFGNGGTGVTDVTFSSGTATVVGKAVAIAAGVTSAAGVLFRDVSAGATGSTVVNGAITPSGTISPLGAQVAIKADSSGQSATADFAATGTLTTGVVSNQTSPASLSATGTLGAVATANQAAAAILSATGTLVANTATGQSVTAAFSATGTLVTTAKTAQAAAGALSGTGTLSTTPTIGKSATAAYSASGTLAVSVATPIELWIANQPMWVAHRGGSVNWPQHTMFAYTQAAQWSTKLALEISVWKSLDGYWVANHDNDPATTGQWTDPSSGTITTRNWIGDLDRIKTTVGNYPMELMTSIINAFPGRLFFIDNKASTDMTGHLNLLDSLGGNARFIIKGFWQDNTKSVAARARGYKTWGYYYDGEESNLPATEGRWDILGMAGSAGTPAWTAVDSYGKPVLAHIINSAANYAIAAARNPEGYMVSDVQHVVPQDPFPATLSATGTLAAAGIQGLSRAAAFSATGTLTASTPTGQSVTATLSGSGTLTAASKMGYALTASLAATGTLGASAKAAQVTIATLGATGTLVAGSKQNAYATAVFNAIGTLTTFTGPPPFIVGSYNYHALLARPYTGYIPAEELS